MELVTRAFYSRSDLDLILTSPASARKVFAVRMGGLRLRRSAIAVLLAAPFINVLAFLGGSRWLGAYGVVAAMGAVATAAALALTIALFRIIGAKAYAPYRANRGRGDRRGLRHRPANCGDFLCRQLFPVSRHCNRTGAGGMRPVPESVFLVAGTCCARRLRRARRGLGVRHTFPRLGIDRAVLALASASTRWRRRASPAPRSAAPLVASFSPPISQAASLRQKGMGTSYGAIPG